MRPYPENSTRIKVIRDALIEHGQEIIQSKLPDISLLKSIHSKDYVDFLSSIPHDITGDAPTIFAPRDVTIPQNFHGKLGYYFFDPATAVTPGSFKASLGAVGTALDTVNNLDSKSISFGLCRPPGHHATQLQGGGYCFFNNAAVSAQHLVNQGKSVTVLDLDYHHGNGTQSIFYDTNLVQFISIHADPSLNYPFYWGYKDEIGIGDGKGFTSNFPISQFTTGDQFLVTLDLALQDLEKFDPDVIILSMGFDTHIADPIAGMQLHEEDFRRIGKRLKEYDKIAVLLEGGYDVASLGVSFIELMEGLGG